MSKIGLMILVLSLSITTCCFAQEKTVMLVNFEGPISGVPDGTVDAGSGNGSSVEIAPDTNIKYEGQQSLRVTYDAVLGGYIWIAKGIGLDVKNADWLVKPEDIKWNQYKAIAFYVYGSDSKTKVAIDLKDNGSEMWRYTFEDNFKGWKRIICPFDQFMARTDWQPNNSDNNTTIDFPLRSFQFEPLPPGKGTLYFDQAELVEK